MAKHNRKSKTAKDEIRKKADKEKANEIDSVKDETKKTDTGASENTKADASNSNDTQRDEG